MPLRDTTKGGLMVFAAAAGFGTLAIFGKLAVQTGPSIATLLLFRFVVGTIILWFGFGYLGQLRRLSGRRLGIALALGSLYGIMTGLFFWGLEYLSASLAALILYSYPAYVFLLSTVVLNERLTQAKLLALVLVGIGVRITVGSNLGDVNAMGLGLVLASSVGYAVYTTGSRAAISSVEVGPFVTTALVATTVTMVPFGLLFGDLSVPRGPEQWRLVGGIGIIGTAVPLILFVRGLEQIEASHASIIGTAEPVVTVLLAIGLLGEPVTTSLVAGGTCILTGALLMQRGSQHSGVMMR